MALVPFYMNYPDSNDTALFLSQLQINRFKIPSKNSAQK